MTELDRTAQVLAETIISEVAEFFKERKIANAVVGLSGGIDSAVTSYIAVRALGNQNVFTATMPNEGITSEQSTDLGIKIAENLNTNHCHMPITQAESAITTDFFQAFGQYRKVETRENLQSRLRAVILMALANDNNALLLSTGNQTEDELGYFTLYGDGCGAVAPLGLIPKTLVYAIGRYLNATYGNKIPEECFTRPATAELSVGQVDPFDYEKESFVVASLVEVRFAVQQMENTGVIDEDVIESWIANKMMGISNYFSIDIDRLHELWTLMNRNAFKRSQSAPPLDLPMELLSAMYSNVADELFQQND